jgi:hypothetical protein
MQNHINILQVQIQHLVLQSNIICTGLLNPRGLAFDQHGDLLLIEAGAAELKPPYSGQFTRRDKNKGTVKQTLLSGYRALNMQARMLRDEIMGLADIAPSQVQQTENSPWLVAFTDYINGSKIIEVKGDKAVPLFETQGNINSLCYHPVRNAWYCIKPDTNEVVEFIRNQPERVVCVLPDLALAQEPVPVNIVYQASTEQLLITLFSGELGRGDEYKGIDFVKQQGAIVSVEPQSGEVTELVSGLTLPTGLCITDDDQLLVTELCDDFLQPLPPDSIPTEPVHGGFKRFSGRLLRLDLAQGTVELLATGLDTPSNLAVSQQSIYISEGMGLPGRPIPDLNGISQPLSGYIRQLKLAN